MNGNSKIVSRYDSLKHDTLKKAELVERRYRLIAPHEYNTVMPFEGGYVVTNKFDPRCNDKVTPLTPGYVKLNPWGATNG